MVDCVEGARDSAMQQPTKYLCRIAMEQRTVVKARSARDGMHRNNDIVDAQ
jgi:hypothetical protein